MPRRFRLVLSTPIALALLLGLCFAASSTDLLNLIDVVPVVADWDHDGHLDLLVSTQEGQVFALRSRDGLERPEFASVFPLTHTESGTEKLIIHNWEWTAPCIDAVDWNGDGLTDLLIADSSRTIAYYQRRRAPDGSLVLDPPVTLRFSDGTPLGYPICSEHRQKMALRVVDWNLDGKNDLALGENECYFLENRGTATSPEFIRPDDWTSANWCVESGVFEEYELFGLSGDYAMPNVVDWDHDGLLDVICGIAWRWTFPVSDVTVGFIIYRRNEGTNASPLFPDESLDPPSIMFLRSDPHRDFIRHGRYSVPYASDVDANGWVDLLVGGDGPLRLYIRNERKELELLWELAAINY